MGVFDRLKNSWKLFSYSFKLLGKDKSLIALPVIMFFSSAALLVVLGLLYFGAIFVLDKIYLYIFGLLLLLIFYFWSTFLASAQSWMVYEVTKGKDTTVGSGFGRAGKNFFDILWFSLAVLAIAVISRALKDKGKIGQISAGFLDVVSGIVGRLVLPAMIITEQSFGQAVMSLGKSLKSWPEVVTYEVGIRPLKAFFVYVGVIASILLMFVNFIIGVIFLVIYIVLFVMVTKYVEITYYTLLYIVVIEKKKIPGLDITGLAVDKTAKSNAKK
jgi:hypothetical protein